MDKIITSKKIHIFSKKIKSNKPKNPPKKNFKSPFFKKLLFIKNNTILSKN